MTVWFDLTDLTAWRGPFTGIQRVQFELARRLRTQGAAFLEFEARTASFVAVDPAVIDRIGRQATAPTRPAEAAPAGHLLQRSVRAARRRLSRGRTARRRRAEQDAVRRRVDADTTDWSPCRPGDSLVLVGTPWRFPGIAGAIGRVQRSGVAITWMVHDLIPLLMPHVVSARTVDAFRTEVVPVLRSADRLITTSHAVATDVATVVTRPSGSAPISVVPLASDRPGGPEVEPTHLGLGGAPFLLMVGTFEIRKNYGLIHLVYRLAAERGIRLPRLVIVCRSHGWLADDIYQTIKRDPVVNQQITIAHDIDDDGRRWLFRHCLFTVMTSVAEGWGLPLTEAASFCKVAVTSDLPSAHEAIGDEGVYFSPYDSAACLERIVEMLDDQRRLPLEARLADRAVRTWDQYTSEFMTALTAP